MEFDDVNKSGTETHPKGWGTRASFLKIISPIGVNFIMDCNEKLLNYIGIDGKFPNTNLHFPKYERGEIIRIPGINNDIYYMTSFGGNVHQEIIIRNVPY